ncbi:MAG TPA: hypothetical protein VF411_08440 [Bacteroidia bacterium]
MGGFFLLMFILPATAILLVLWLTTWNNLFGKILLCFWLSLFGLMLLGVVVNFFTSKTNLKRNDIYGEYVIARAKCRGKQADWQYDHFRFEIIKPNIFLFHVTDKDKILKTYKGALTFLEEYERPRIVLQVDTPRHHIIEDKPTLYREPFSFYYVFHSTKFGNVFFEKGHWKPIGN